MATKAQLEKELKKALTKLNFYEEACRKQPDPEKTNEVMFSGIAKPAELKIDFEQLTNRLTQHLKVTQDTLFMIVDKVRMIDGDESKPLEKLSSDKVYKMGVIGVYDQLNDVAMDNEIIANHALTRLKNLVG